MIIIKLVLLIPFVLLVFVLLLLALVVGIIEIPFYVVRVTKISNEEFIQIFDLILSFETWNEEFWAAVVNLMPLFGNMTYAVNGLIDFVEQLDF